MIDVGLLFGPKPRLILSYLNTQAILNRTPQIEVEASLTAFVKCVGLDAGGRNCGAIKDQLARLAATNIKLGFATSETTVKIVNAQIITSFDLWFPKDQCQRVVWPTSIVFSREYFDTLVDQAVPLDERALAALSHSAMALDIYAWLSHLHARCPACVARRARCRGRNRQDRHQLSISTPFGGQKLSSIGREKGRDGIRKYMAQKSIYLDMSGEPHPWAGIARNHTP